MRKLIRLTFSAFVLVILPMTYAATRFKYQTDDHTLGLWHFDDGQQHRQVVGFTQGVLENPKVQDYVVSPCDVESLVKEELVEKMCQN